MDNYIIRQERLRGDFFSVMCKELFTFMRLGYIYILCSFRHDSNEHFYSLMTKHRFPEGQHMRNLPEMHVSEELVPNMLTMSRKI